VEYPNRYGGYKGSTVTINDSISKDSKQVENTLAHEIGHVRDARTNTDQFGKESQHTRETKGAMPHDSRPEEKAANKFKDEVNSERKQFKKEHKRDKKQNQ
jgi:hypothetical protein